jgi:Domain of unknown function (DUF4249)
LAILLAILFSCSLEREININLPAYGKQLVVEFYLERNQPVKVLVTESDPYFDTLRFPFVKNAIVLLNAVGVGEDTIPFLPAIDIESRKFYNYGRADVIISDTSVEYSLSIRDSIGRELTGKTRFLPLPDVDTIEVRYSPDADSLAGFLVWLNDIPDQTNFYRIIMNVDSLTGSPSVDFTFTDNGLNGKRFPIGTSYRFERNHKMIIRIYHIEQQYYNYLRSMEAASRANGNPFAQPATILSPMKGDGFGIFTTLNQRKFLISY